MATTAASFFCSAPAIASEEEQAGDTTATPIIDNSDTTSTTDSVMPEDAPVAKEKTIEYTVQDFTMALPANWKVITKYDEKSAKPPTTPTLFSAIDFNSGAVISIVREEACSVTDYAKSSFEKSSKNNKGKKCDFVLKSSDEGNPFQNLFLADTYEKDASKLLIRHDDRDNAVLRGVSRIEDAKLVGNAGLRRFPPDFFFPNDSAKTDSYSSSLLELRATTTIPTGGTSRDTMGLEQPNTIDRKVLAKAVATTTRITQTVEFKPQTLSSERELLATQEITGDEAPNDIIAPDGSTTNDETTSFAGDTTSSKSNDAPEKISETVLSSDPTGEVIIASDTSKQTNSVVDITEPDSNVVQEKATVIASKPSDNEPQDDQNVSNTKENLLELSARNTNGEKSESTVETSNETTMVSSDANYQEESPTASRVAMMAMAATVDETANGDSGESQNTEPAQKSLSADDIEKAVETAMEKAMETAIEAVKENAIEPTIEAVMETAKETAKEMALEMLKANAESQTGDSDAVSTSVRVSTSSKDEERDDTPTRETVALASTPDASTTDLDTGLSTSNKDFDANATPMANAEASEPVPIPATTTTMTTSVLSIWLSAPLDEWQKPVMGTRLNQIWESVQYTSDIIEGSDSLALLSQDDDDSMNTQLLLMNNKAIR